MKFRPYLEQIEGIDVYPLIGLVLSFGLFIIVVLWVLSLKKEQVNAMKNIPLNQNEKQEEI